MAVFRVEKNQNYTVMAKFHLMDESLSLKAVGLLSKMLSLPDEWDYTVAGLVSICKEGKDAITAAIKELESAGYIIRRQTHDETGAFAGNEYIIFEVPQSTSESQPTAPLTENPSTDKPSTENPPQLSTKDIDIPPIVPQKAKRKRRAELPDWKPDRFEAFWKFFPRCENNRLESKTKTRRVWNKLQPDDDLIRTMARALIEQKRTEMWTKGIGIPYASTWLNQRRWEDEPLPLDAEQDKPATPDSTLGEGAYLL